MATRQEIGRRGEDLAAAYVTERGWRVLDRNWRSGAVGELDLVALDGDALVAVEVKTRSSAAFGHPAEAVTADKVARLRRLTARWLAAHDLHPASVRIDVLAIVLAPGRAPRIDHLAAVV
ncbi:MAG TPA: YraN family protein [Cellulomonas sp.]